MAPFVSFIINLAIFVVFASTYNLERRAVSSGVSRSLSSSSASRSESTISSAVSSSDNGIGSFIVNGLKGAASSTVQSTSSTPSIITASATRSSSNAFATGTASFSNSTTSSNNTFPSPWVLDVTGSASSCYSTLWQWWFTSSALAASSELYSTQTFTFTRTAEIPDPLTSLDLPASEITTLCDGHPRKLHTQSITNSTVFVRTSTSIVTGNLASYSPQPCAIAASDCSALWKSYTSAAATRSFFPSSVPLPPPCPTTGSSIKFEDGLCRNQYGNLVDADYAQLIYWPVRYANSSKNESAYGFCDNDNAPGKTTYEIPMTAPGSRTGDGPNTFVTAGVTITSPDVGIFLSNLYVRPGCGTTINTVITMPASELKSGVAARVLLHPKSFNLNDLNWVCEDLSHPNATWTTRDTVGQGRCYQDVPAVAYFSAEERYDAYTATYGWNKTLAQRLPIYQDYRPVVDLFNQPIATDMLVSVFGGPAAWNIAGVWDPPLAVTAVSSLIAPGAGTTTQANTPLTTTSASPLQPAPSPTNAATPQSVTLPAPSPTNAQPNNPTQAASQSTNNPSQATSHPNDPTPANTLNNASPAGGNAGTGTSADPANSPPNASAAAGNGAGGNGNGVAGSSPTTQPSSSSPPVVVIGTGQSAASVTLSQQAPVIAATTPASQVITLGSSTLTAVASGSNVVIGGSTIGPGNAATIGGQQVSIVDPGSNAAAGLITANVGGSSITISNVAAGTAVVNGQTITQGGAAQTLANGQQVSLAAGGVVVGAESSASTVAVPNKDSVFSVSSVSSGVVAVDGQTLTQGGAAKTLSNGQVVSLAPSGIVIGSGSLASTLTLPSGGNLVAIGSTTLRDSSMIGGLEVLSNGQTTFTLTPGGSATTIRGQVISAASTGLVVSSVSAGTTASNGSTAYTGDAAKITRSSLAWSIVCVAFAFIIA